MNQTGATAIVLAGDRGANDPIATATGAPCKALSPVAGTPMILRVLDALSAAERVHDLIVVGPASAVIDANPEFTAALAARGARWLIPARSPSVSAARALAELPPTQPVLLTSADHALLRASTVDAFLADAGITDAGGLDMGVALVGLANVRAAYPNVRRTAIRLRPGAGYCSANLFALRGTAARQIIQRWQTLEHQRKHPARYLTSLLGWPALVRYALGRLTLDDAFARAGARIGARIGPVLLADPTAAIDVDSATDLALVEAIAGQQRCESSARARGTDPELG